MEEQSTIVSNETGTYFHIHLFEPFRYTLWPVDLDWKQMQLPKSLFLVIAQWMKDHPHKSWFGFLTMIFFWNVSGGNISFYDDPAEEEKTEFRKWKQCILENSSMEEYLSAFSGIIERTQ